MLQPIGPTYNAYYNFHDVRPPETYIGPIIPFLLDEECNAYINASILYVLDSQIDRWQPQRSRWNATTLIYLGDSTYISTCTYEERVMKQAGTLVSQVEHLGLPPVGMVLKASPFNNIYSMGDIDTNIYQPENALPVTLRTMISQHDTWSVTLENWANNDVPVVQVVTDPGPWNFLATSTALTVVLYLVFALVIFSTCYIVLQAVHLLWMYHLRRLTLVITLAFLSISLILYSINPISGTNQNQRKLTLPLAFIFDFLGTDIYIIMWSRFLGRVQKYCALRVLALLAVAQLIMVLFVIVTWMAATATRLVNAIKTLYIVLMSISPGINLAIIVGMCISVWYTLHRVHKMPISHPLLKVIDRLAWALVVIIIKGLIVTVLAIVSHINIMNPAVVIFRAIALDIYFGVLDLAFAIIVTANDTRIFTNFARRWSDLSIFTHWSSSLFSWRRRSRDTGAHSEHLASPGTQYEHELNTVGESSEISLAEQSPAEPSSSSNPPNTSHSD
ncbi:hypothetical protein IWQ61_004301 [Dispira simplex]|nr:hypothetical protein IWQ61_004301 [Dispira simplex]